MKADIYPSESRKPLLNCTIILVLQWSYLISKMYEDRVNEPLNDEEKRQCFSLLQLIVRDFLEAHDRPVTFTPQNRMDLFGFLFRMTRFHPICDGVKDILRAEASAYCHKIIQMLSNTRNNKEYILYFRSYLGNYLTSIKDIAKAMFPPTQLFEKGKNYQETEQLLEEMFCNGVIKSQRDRLSSILASNNSPNADMFDLSKLQIQLEDTEVVESGAQHKRMGCEEEDEMEADNQLKRVRSEEEEMEEDQRLKRMRMETE